jgi:hypothetical protein
MRYFAWSGVAGVGMLVSAACMMCLTAPLDIHPMLVPPLMAGAALGVTLARTGVAQAVKLL